MMHSRTNTLHLVTTTLLVCASSYSAARAEVLLVPEDFQYVHTALAAAQDGDIVSLGAGTQWADNYTIVSDKSLVIEGRPGAVLYIPDSSQIALTFADGAVATLRDLELAGRVHVTTGASLSVERVVRSEVFATELKQSVTANGALSVTIRDSALSRIYLTSVEHVVVQQCALEGKAGNGASATQDFGGLFGIIPGHPGGRGGDALRVTDCASVRLENSTFLGGNGGGGVDIHMSHVYGTFNAGPGGNGITALEGSHVLHTSTTFIPGLHGTPVYGPTPADGAPTVADATSTISSTISPPRTKSLTSRDVESTEFVNER